MMLGAERILRALQEHDVDYVLIGALAATVHGSVLRRIPRDRAQLPALRRLLDGSGGE